ncbi:MAG TPA: hypothetical protein VHM71_02760, partial [Candidatus Deferrimicrobium sp.]|nr:hypothetical protein [Candidatus Deferrimicrobium sp.]
HYVTYIAEATFAIGVVVVGKLIQKRKAAAMEKATADGRQGGEPAKAAATSGTEPEKEEV